MQRSVGRRRGKQQQQPVPPPAAGPATSEPTLADEVEAFVNGELVELLVAAGRPVPLPSWLALNRLSHAPLQVLARVAAGEPAAGAPERDLGWAEAERSLAFRLLSCGRDPNDVRRVQREVLVPLERRLIAESRVLAIPVGQVIARAVEALDQHQSRR
jgi:hypothetical protein